MQLSLADRALQTQQEPVVERAGMIETVEVADHSVSNATEIKQPVQVTVIARDARTLESQHQASMAKCDLARSGAQTPRDRRCRQR